MQLPLIIHGKGGQTQGLVRAARDQGSRVFYLPRDPFTRYLIPNPGNHLPPTSPSGIKMRLSQAQQLKTHNSKLKDNKDVSQPPYRHPESHGSAPAHGAQSMDIPDLRVLPMDALLLHEQADKKRVARLETRLHKDGYLKNPPIVAPIPGTERYVVLDGANRTSAVRRIGCPHLLVQVVDYNSNSVQLLTWHHLITGRGPDTFLAG